MKKGMDNLNNTQKTLIVLFILNFFLGGLYQNIYQDPQDGMWGITGESLNGDELTIMIGVSIALLIGIFLFKSRN